MADPTPPPGGFTSPAAHSYTPPPPLGGTPLPPGAHAAGGQPERTSAPSGTAVPNPNSDATATLTQLLNSYGLGSLLPWMQQQLVQGVSPTAIPMLITQTPQFAQRFPGIVARQQAGLPPISPAEYINYEDQLAQLYRTAGLPRGFYDTPTDVGNLIGSDVSINEMTDRVNQGLIASQQAPQEVRDQLGALYGIDQGHLAAFFLDPTTAEPIIMRKFQAAQVAGTAQLAGYGQLGTQTAEHLASLGLSQGQLQQGFSTLGTEAQLFQGLPGTAEDNIGQEQQLGAQFEGNAADQLAILARQRQRQAAFQGGAQYQTTQTGTPGLGTVQRT